MAHQTDPKDPNSWIYGHTVGEYPNPAKDLLLGKSMPTNPSVVRPGEAKNFVDTNNARGVSGSRPQDFTGYGALSNYLPIAEKYMNQMYSVSEEEQAKEDRIRLGMNMLTFFTQMGAEASKPGATALGAANIAGANTAQQYINQVEAKKARDFKIKSGAISLATQLMGKDQTTGTPKAYNVLNPTIVNRLFGTKLNQNDKISLTAKQFNQLPIGSVADYAEPKSQKRVPIYKVDDGTSKIVIEFGKDYNTNLDSGNYTTVKPDMGTIKEDEFGVQFFVGGKNDGKRVRDVFNEDKIKKGENVDTETEDDAGNIVSTEPTLVRLTKTQHTQAKDFRKSIMDQTKDYRDDIEPGFRKILQFFNDQDPIGDYALAVGFAKMIDPGSVAKEGEVRAVQKSGSLPEELKAQLINALTGQGPLPPRVRAGIVNRAIDIYNSERQKVTSVIERVSKSWASQIQRSDQQGHIVHFDVGKEYKGEKIDLSTLPESSVQPFEFDEGAVKQLSIPQLTAVLQQNLTKQQIKFVLEVLQEKKKRGK